MPRISSFLPSIEHSLRMRMNQFPESYSVHTVQLHRESKKQDTKLSSITSQNINRFSQFFTNGLGSKLFFLAHSVYRVTDC